MAKLFTYGPANVDSLLATTRSAILEMQDYLADQIFQQIPLLKWMMDKSLVKKDGGASILVPLLYSKNSTFKWYSGYDTLDTTPQEGLTMAQYQWKNAAVSISISGDEERKNSGSNMLYSMMKAKTAQAMNTIKDQVNSALFATTQVSNAIGCLPTLIDNTSIVGDINSTSNSWWQAQVTAAVGSFATGGLAAMTTLYNKITNQGLQGGLPDIGLCDQATYEAYENSQRTNQRYVMDSAAKPTSMNAGFDTLRFKGANIMYDPNCNTGTMYMLRSDNLQLVTHKDAMFNVTDFVKPANQDARTAQIIFMTELVTNNRRKLGKLTGITA
jgi:hypothetical protein